MAMCPTVQFLFVTTSGELHARTAPFMGAGAAHSRSPTAISFLLS